MILDTENILPGYFAFTICWTDLKKNFAYSRIEARLIIFLHTIKLSLEHDNI